MNRLLAALILVIVVAQSADAAPKRAYKARQQEAAEADAQTSSASSPATTSAEYEKELQAAREQRDQKLQSLDEEGIDRRTLEKRKTEIFAEYARILAAMRDKYEAANPPAPAPTKRKPARSTGTARATPPPLPPVRSTRNSRSNGRATQDTASALADAERKLQEENDRHAARMEELNTQLRQAEASGNKREIRRVRKAIEKENNTYNAKRPILERRVVDLGGKVGKSSPAEARAQ